MPAGDRLSRENWLAAERVLTGECGDVVSVRSAAAAAGVSVRELKAWVERSREQRVEDDDWIHGIAEVWDSRDELQAGILEDVLWKNAVNGVTETIVNAKGDKTTKNKANERATIRMLEVRDRRYRPKAETNTLVVTDNPLDLLAKLQAAKRLAEIEASAPEGEFRTLPDLAELPDLDEH